MGDINVSGATSTPATRFILHWVRVKRQPFTTQDALYRLPEMISHNCYLEPCDDSVQRTIQLKVVDAYDWYMTDPSEYTDVEAVQLALQNWSTFADDERAESVYSEDARSPHHCVTLDLARQFVDKCIGEQQRAPFSSCYVTLNDDEIIVATTDRRSSVQVAEWHNAVFSFYEAACLGRKTARPWYFQESHPLQPHQRVFEKPLRNKPSPIQHHMRSVYAFPLQLESVHSVESALTHVCDKSHLSLHCEGADPMWRDIFDAWPYVVDMMSASGYHVDDTQRDASAYLHCLLPECQLKLAQSLLEAHNRVSQTNDGAVPTERCAVVFVLRAANQSASTGVDSIKAIVNYAKLAKIDRVHVLSALPFSTTVQVDAANRRESPHLVLWPLNHHRFEWFNHTYAVPMAGLSSNGDDDRGDDGGSRAPPVQDECERNDMGNNGGASSSSNTAVFDASRETILYNFVDNVVLGGIFSKASRHGVDKEEGDADKQLTMSALGHLYASRHSFMKLASDSPATKRLGLKENDILHVQKRYPKTSKVVRRVVASSLAK